MCAHQHARIGHATQHGVEPVAASPAFDGVAPGQHDTAAAQLRFHLVGEVVVVDRGNRTDPGAREGLEQRVEPAFGWVGAIPHGAVARVQQCDAGRGHGHFPTSGRPADCQASMPPRRKRASTQAARRRIAVERPTSCP